MVIKMDNYLYLKDTYECSISAEDVLFSVLINKFLPNTSENITDKTVISDTISKIMHTHAYIELFICVNGDSYVNTSCGSKLLRSGDMLLIPAGIRHIKTKDDSDWASIGFTYFKKKNNKNRCFFDRLNKLCLSTTPKLMKNQHAICSEIYNLLRDTSLYDSEITALHMLDILLRINETDKGESRSETVPELRAGKKIDKDINRLSQLEKIFELSFMQDIHPSEVAAKLCISERQLNRLIRLTFDTTFHNLIIERRLNAAAQMLETTELSAEAVANAVGFNSKSVFYSAFRKKYNTTPVGYRNNRQP